MKSTQARLAKFLDKLDGAQLEVRMHAYTMEQMLNWTETDWNWHMRKALEQQGFRTFHIREASETGIADLIVYRMGGFPVGGRHIDQVIEAWIELKKDNDKTSYEKDPRKAAQRQFMREHWQESRNAIYMMFDRKVGMLAVYQGELRGRVKMLPAYPYANNWQEVFAHFKSRKVAL